jgi:hypothetical protein
MAYQGRTKVKNIAGFTLVEGVVGSFLTMIIVAVMYTFFTMNSQLVARGALNTKIQMQYTTAVEQIGRTARRAASVFAAGEPWKAEAQATPDTATSIWMYDATGHPIGGYQIAGTELLEWVNNEWKNFRVGSSDVKVKTASAFFLADDRRSVTLDIAVVSSGMSLADTALSKNEVFLCRN